MGSPGQNIKHIDLFSGIGGFALACEWAGIETILFCEIDKFCQKVLRKHWDVPIVEDINNVEEIKAIADTYNQREQQQERVDKEFRGRIIDRNQITTNAECCRAVKGYSTARESFSEHRRFLILTAGFPCQPFSNAGRKRGSADDRYLWPQTLRVIEAVKSDWIILENVSGILNMVFPDSGIEVASQASFHEVPHDEISDYDTISGRIESDLRQAGYETVWFVIPACGLGAPHRRDRVWIVANRKGNGCNRWIEAKRWETQDRFGRDKMGTESIRQDSNATDTTEQGLERTKSERAISGGCFAERNNIPGWQENWYAVATRVCTMDDGISNGLVRPKGWRVNALKAAGNSIVPQVAHELIRNILVIERNLRLERVR
jgi:DNA (cytosine-5)-methyltransferase 1